MNELVSVIIPTYGRPDSLKKCIDSVLNQSYKHIEIIIVDDNEPESEFRFETQKLMNSYKNYVNISYLQHEENKNASAARNTGFDQSNGKYICFLDDDDEFVYEKIEKQVSFLEENRNFQACYCAHKKNGKTIFQNLQGELSKKLLLLEYHPVTSTIMFKREAIIELNGFDDTFRRHQDYEIMLRFFEKFKIGYLNEPLLISGKNDGSNIPKGKNLNKLKSQFLSEFEETISRLENTNPGFKNLVYSRHYSRVFWNHLKNGYVADAIIIFLKIFLNSPIEFIRELLRYFKLYKTHS